MSIKFLVCFTFFISSYLCSAQDIFEAARTGNIAQIKALSKVNRDTVNTVSASGFSPLMIACYRGQTEAAKTLVKLGADINRTSGEGTALLASVYQNNTELALFLIKKKAALNAQGPDGNTALMYAVLSQNVEIVKALVKHKADKSIKNLDSQTAHSLALTQENKLIQDLVKP